MRLSSFFLIAAISTVTGMPKAAATNLDPATFSETVWASSAALSQTTGIGWAPDGTNRLFAIRKTGQVMIVQDGTPLATPWATMTPYTNSECGLIGFAFHPSFVQNRYVYVFITVSSSVQQIQRWIDDPITNTGTFDKIIVDNLPTQGINHDGGAVGFGRDGYLYWSIGDNGSPRRGIDNDLTLLAAKVGRATAEGAVPLDNPFYDGPGPNNDFIFARGFRNPFTMTFRPATGELWLDVVGDTWEQAFVVPKGGHGGWDDLENTQTGSYLTPAIAYRTRAANTRTLVNASRVGGVATFGMTTPHGYRRGTQVTISGTTDASFSGTFFITSTPSTTSFTVTQAGADASTTGGTATQAQMGGAIGGGTFYASTRFPEAYWGNYFFGDYVSGQFFRATLDEVGVASVAKWADYGVALDTTVGPDGALYASTFNYGTPGIIYRTVPVAVPADPIVTPTTLWLVEGGRAAFTVVLPSAPAMPTLLAVLRASGDTDLTIVEGATLSFDATNWDKPQRVVIDAAIDADRVDDTATFSITGTGYATRTVDVFVPDAPPVIYAYPSPLTLTEGSSATLSIGLSEAATGPVTVEVAITGDPDVTAPAMVTFQPSDGTAPKTITVSAAFDADLVSDTATFTVSAPGYTSRVVPVVVIDTMTSPDLLPSSADLLVVATPDLSELELSDLAEPVAADLASEVDLAVAPSDDLLAADDLADRADATAHVDFAAADLVAAPDLTDAQVNLAGGGCACRAGEGEVSGSVLLTMTVAWLLRARRRSQLPRPRA